VAEYQSFFGEVDDTRSLRTYFGDIGKIPLLTREEEVVLARRAKAGERDAVRRMAESNLRFVVSIAKNYRNRGMPMPDLINEGNIGLMKAIQHFDPERGVRFISYAVWWIRQSITESLQEYRSMIHIPANRVEDANRRMRTEQSLAQRLGREPSDAELAKEVGVSPAEADRFQGDTPSFVSLEHPLGDSDEDRTMGEILRDDETPPIESLVHLSALRSDISGVLEVLPKKERRILEMRFGLRGQSPLTLQEAGKKLGLSRERIRQLENRALARLRQPGRSTVLREYLN
jgi:RNA polymerase primary sigma factor